MSSDSCEDQWSIFPLTENLTNSYVDTSKLISYMSSESQNRSQPIGMANFRSKLQNRTLRYANSLPMPVANGTLNANQQSKSFIYQTLNSSNNVCSSSSAARLRWKAAAVKVKLMHDPWSEFKLDSYPAENVIRHRYNAIKKQWIKDECTVKIESEQFANGAMRACFRLKKLSNIVHKTSWEHASNYVAKSYMDSSIGRERYFDDVKLQMDAKLWAEIYNRHNPPKKIDMFQVSVLEFKNRPGSPLFHLEHFIEGKYIKYNSNSGFVEDSHMRLTPHAFSHFTFECSNHELMVVDVQGVGDLYTDPQIHSSRGTEYGEGNLGIKGFALFFSSHICNDVCRSLGLTQFDLAPTEVKSHEKLLHCMQKFCLTQSRGHEETVNGSPSSYGEYFRHRIRSRSDTSMCSDENSNSNDLPDISESEGYESSSSPSPLFSPTGVPIQPTTQPMTIRTSGQNNTSNNFSANQMNFGYNFQQMSSHPISIPSEMPAQQISRTGGRIREESCCLDSAFSMDEAVSYFNSKSLEKPRPACVFAERDYILNLSKKKDEEYDFKMINRMNSNDEDESILGKIHLELCKYHEMGRFLADENQQIDVQAAFFHLKQAANLGILEALINLGKIYLQLPHDILPNYKVENTDANLDIGFECMLLSSEKGDKNSMFFIAKALDTGVGLSKNRSIDWLKALEYYQKVINASDDESNAEDTSHYEMSSDCEPTYTILARMAEINLLGINGVEKDCSEAASLYTEAADKAMLYGKGRIANKYFMLAEQASSMDDY